ncbi:MAG TPA: hypothetical protein VMB20_03735 [Candidatus Acidoferrum sp.]|nr:hypothetical protein [Candidatus Acidoferrum sp.]
MANATAAYRLNPEMQEVLGTRLIRIIVREQTVIGHFGRYGYISGSLTGHDLDATLRDKRHEGHLTVTFDDGFTSFNGQYASAADDRTRSRLCSGTRVTRRKP